MMRNAMLALLVLSAAGAATVAGSGPADAYDYPYCLQGRGVGVPGDLFLSVLRAMHGERVRTIRLL
jgi:hypothetical protein